MNSFLNVMNVTIMVLAKNIKNATISFIDRYKHNNVLKYAKMIK